MARESQWVKVGKREVELSNLTKTLDPTVPVVKAEIVNYYLSVAPTFLRHARGRPLSLVRYPDGIEGEQFFQKSRPDWAPEWIGSVRLDKKSQDYMVADATADVVWLANLACLELHVTQGRIPHPHRPDQIVFDLDPPPDFPYTRVIELAAGLGEQLRGYGYHPFCKTSGQKGIHVVVPIEPRWEIEKVMEAAHEVTGAFVRRHKDETTLNWSQKARETRVLIDLNRNRKGQTAVAAYSLRGKPGLPVSMPLTWEELATLEDASPYNYATVPRILEEKGDPWEAMAAYAVAIHTDRAPAVAAGDPETLKAYEKKRDFDITSEPGPVLGSEDMARFTIHRHHATNLHYDLRLEQDGVLKSWALPRGLPHEPGVKRLAVEVEEHPIKYLTWEGVIPKGEYGAGPMWVYATGRYTVTKEKKTGFYFRLHSEQINADYRMHRTQDKQWLLERVHEPDREWLKGSIPPLLCEKVDAVPIDDNWHYEVKWDGIRAIITVIEQQVTIWSRNGNDITDQFPELSADGLNCTTGVFDGEIVVLDDAGRPEFGRVIKRLHARGEGAVARAAKKHPAVCYLFDCLYLDGRPVVKDPIERRRAWLEDLIRPDHAFRFSQTVADGDLLFKAVKQQGLEGIVAKRKESRYIAGRRSGDWLKIKSEHEVTLRIIGFTRGSGARSETVGSLVVAEDTDDGLVYRGHLGTGFTDRALDELQAALMDLERMDRPDLAPDDQDKSAEWIKPQVYCDAIYSQLTSSGMLRQGAFKRLRPDLE
ncbi:MAG: non-homologous end-joining DNA ligase [Rhodothermales bacterium]|nr:non-homologous end-joining DNA ligase [Rhodothermales bacterium]MBO6779200.1 non-homologous end-joining DNA ligase [Rhodothermales bacterium]